MMFQQDIAIQFMFELNSSDMRGTEVVSGTYEIIFTQLI